MRLFRLSWARSRCGSMPVSKLDYEEPSSDVRLRFVEDDGQDDEVDDGEHTQTSAERTKGILGVGAVADEEETRTGVETECDVKHRNVGEAQVEGEEGDGQDGKGGNDMDGDYEGVQANDQSREKRDGMPAAAGRKDVVADDKRAPGRVEMEIQQVQPTHWRSDAEICEPLESSCKALDSHKQHRQSASMAVWADAHLLVRAQ